MALRKGGEAAQKASENAGGGAFARVNYLSIEDDGQEFVRYLIDQPDWVFVNQHAGAPTKNPPADWGADTPSDKPKPKWPESMPAVCRLDEAFDGEDGFPNYTECYICESQLPTKYGRPSKAAPRVWTLACLRDEVIGTPELVAQGVCDESKIGKRIGFKDRIRKVQRPDPDNKDQMIEVEERAIVVVNFAPNNYFNALTATWSIYGSVCDRDFVVKKSGKGKDVEYTNVALSETPNLMPGTDSWKRYDDAIKEQGLDLAEIIKDRASDEYFARFFDPSKTPAPRKGEGSANGASAQPDVPAQAADDVDPEKLAAMRDRVRANSGAVPAGVGASEID